MPDLRNVAEIAAASSYFGIVCTLRADNSVQASLVSAGVSTHPISGRQVLAFVAAGPVKLANLRARPHTTVTFYQGRNWITVEGTAELAGPDDHQLGLAQDYLTRLLRNIFTEAGGTHDDWPTYDRTMARERRVAVLITPLRIYGN
jgi:PPOX class probable F420-dependent enzyme